MNAQDYVIKILIERLRQTFFSKIIFHGSFQMNTLLSESKIEWIPCCIILSSSKSNEKLHTSVEEQQNPTKSRAQKAKTLRNDCQVPLIFVLHLTGSLLLLRCAEISRDIHTFIHYTLARCYPSSLTHCVFHLTRSESVCGYTCSHTRALLPSHSTLAIKFSTLYSCLPWVFVKRKKPLETWEPRDSFSVTIFALSRAHSLHHASSDCTPSFAGRKVLLASERIFCTSLRRNILLK